MISAFQAARFVILKNGSKVSHMQLNKILYIANCYHVWLYSSFIIDEDFFAYSFGPIVKSVYERTKIFKKNNDEKIFYSKNKMVDDFKEVEIDFLNDDSCKTIEYVLNKYKKKWMVDNFLNSKCPAWKLAKEIKVNSKITIDMICKYAPSNIKSIRSSIENI